MRSAQSRAASTAPSSVCSSGRLPPASLHWRERWPIPPFSSRARWTDSRLVGRGSLVPLCGRSIRPLGLSLLGIWLCRTICATNQPPQPALLLLMDPGTYLFRPEATTPFKSTWPKHKSARPSHPLPHTYPIHPRHHQRRHAVLFAQHSTSYLDSLIAESRLYSSLTMQRP